MAVNGKQKGNGYERTIANLLSERFAKHTGIEKSFRRNPDSGSFFGGTNAQRTEQYDTDYAIYGDLICPRNFNFSIECKNYKTPPTINSIVKQDVGQWDGWLAQCLQDAELAEKVPMMIVKYNRTEDMVFIPADFAVLNKTVGTVVLHYKEYAVYALKEFLQSNNETYFFTEA